MAKVGRPTEYRAEYCDQIIEHMSQGNSITSFAAEMHVDRETVYNWARLNPEFLGALKIAKVKCQKWWEQRLIDTAVGDKGNIAAIIFALKARFAYRDKEPVETLDVPEDSFDTEFGEIRSKYQSTR